MAINRDPDKKPELTDAMLREARQLGLHPVAIDCDEPGAKVGDECGISFFALVTFLPRPGDRIVLENGRTCEVKTVLHKVATEKNPAGKIESIYLFPTVAAVLLNDQEKQQD